MKPILILNFKTYKGATGSKALKLLKICEKVNKKGTVEIMASVQHSDACFAKKVKLPVLVQHVDPFEQGRNTGFVTLESVKSWGVKGTLLNHSEHPLNFDTLKKTIKRCKKARFKSVVFTSSLAEAKKILSLNPDYIAFEDPKLISTGRSITSVNPGAVKRFISLCKSSSKGSVPLCGAGISNNVCLKDALKLGSGGALVSSAFVKSKNPEKMLKNLVVLK